MIFGCHSLNFGQRFQARELRLRAAEAVVLIEIRNSKTQRLEDEAPKYTIYEHTHTDTHTQYIYNYKYSTYMIYFKYSFYVFWCSSVNAGSTLRQHELRNT